MFKNKGILTIISARIGSKRWKIYWWLARNKKKYSETIGL